jgi:formiminotetrahydrofolate cyclodeaminase
VTRHSTRIRGRVDTIEAYLEQLASAEPTPGGGSAAALVAAAAASLVAMVARLTLGNAKLAEHHREAAVLVEQADGLRLALLGARHADEAAYKDVIAAMALPRASEAEKAERGTRLQAALGAAAAEPLKTAQLAGDALRLAEDTLQLDNRSLISDVGCAATFAAAGVEAAAVNVRINHAYLRDDTLRHAQEAALTELERDVSARADRVRASVAAHLRP